MEKFGLWVKPIGDSEPSGEWWRKYSKSQKVRKNPFRQDEPLSVEEMKCWARFFGYSWSTILRWIRRGNLQNVKRIGRGTYIVYSPMKYKELFG